MSWLMDEVDPGPDDGDFAPTHDKDYCCMCDEVYQHGDHLGTDNGWRIKYRHQNYIDWVCSDECSLDYDDEGDKEDYRERWGNELIDGVGFADPGGTSALRAETPDNPRNLPCPTCGRKDMLTPLDVARNYQCDICSDAAERGGEY